MRGADGVKIAVFRKGRADSEFFRAAAHAHVIRLWESVLVGF